MYGSSGLAEVGIGDSGALIGEMASSSLDINAMPVGSKIAMVGSRLAAPTTVPPMMSPACRSTE